MNDGMVDGEAFLERCTGMLELPTHVRAALWLEGFRPTLQAVRGRRVADRLRLDQFPRLLLQLLDPSTRMQTQQQCGVNQTNMG